jgi:Holliday junction resolvase
MTGMGGRYRKGSDFERAVVGEFMDRGWVAFRAAGSGKADRFLPDVVALKGGRVVIVECKATAKDRLSLKPAILSLAEYAARAGGRAFVAVRFFRKRPRFFAIEGLLGRSCYTITEKDEYLTADTVTGEQGRLGDV